MFYMEKVCQGFAKLEEEKNGADDIRLWAKTEAYHITMR